MCYRTCMSKHSESETIAHNLAALATMLDRNAVAVVAGGTCPKCEGPSNPTILARFGHCLRCQSAAFGR